MSPHILIFLCLITPLCAKGGGGRGGSIGRVSSGSRYPPSTGLSGNSYHPSTTYHQSHSYPVSKGMSGNSQRTYSSSYYTHTFYSPPQQISYGSTQHPVFHGNPPTYVYQYKESGSRFDNLLTGLALYNLGRMSSDHHGYNYNYGNPYKEYRESPGETCKFIIHKTNGEYEETRIGCQLITSFIWDAEREYKNQNTMTKSVSVVELKDGQSTVTVQNTSIVDAREVKGPSITVTDGMTCFLSRVSRVSTLKKKVDCGLLQEYAIRSMRNTSSSERAMTIVFLSMFTLIFLQK